MAIQRGAAAAAAAANRRRFYRDALAIGAPVALQRLLATSAGMVDTIMIGALGETAMAAVGLAGLFSNLLFSGYFGFCSGGSIFFAQYWGARDEAGIARAYGLTAAATLAVSLVFGGLAVFAPETVMALYTNNPDIAGAAAPYLRLVGWSYPLQALGFAVSTLLRSVETVRAPLLASAVSQGVNVLANWLLIFGVGGFPRMGLAGAAAGTVISQAVYVAALYLICLHGRAGPAGCVLRLRAQARQNGYFIKKFFSKCVFVVCNEGFFGLGQLCLNAIMGRQVQAGVAALAVFRSIEGFFYAFFGGLAGACAVMVGTRIGAGRLREGRADARRFMALAPAGAVVVWGVVLLARGPALGAYGLTGAARSYAEAMLFIYLIAGALRSFNYICVSIFRAGGETLVGTLVEIGGLFLITVPAVAAAALWLRLPFLAVFALLYLDEAVRFWVLWWYAETGRWVKPVTGPGTG